MSNVVTFPKRPVREKRFQVRPKEKANAVSSMAKTAIENIARMEAEKIPGHEKVHSMTEAARVARLALRNLHFLAIAHNERPWAVRVIEAELNAIKDGIEKGYD